MNSVRWRLLRNGVLMWLASRLPPATSASIGVNSSAFVSLTSVTETAMRPRRSCSRRSAVRMPANPPPRITTLRGVPGSADRGAASGPITVCPGVGERLQAEPQQRAIEHPTNERRKVRADRLGIPCWHAAGEQRHADHADEAPEGHAEGRAGHELVDVCAAGGPDARRVRRAHRDPEREAEEWLTERRHQRDARDSTGNRLRSCFVAPDDSRRLHPRTRHVVEATQHERGPAAEVARAETAAGVAVEVFVEEHEIAPMRILGETVIAAVDRPPAAGVAQEDRSEASLQLVRDLAEIEAACRSPSGIRPAARRRRSGDSARALR